MSLPQGPQPIERILPPKLPYDVYYELVSALGKVIAAHLRSYRAHIIGGSADPPTQSD